MKEIKRVVFRICFCLEMTIFALIYALGSQGWPAWRILKKENSVLEAEIKQFKYEIAQIQDQLYRWENYPAFYKEKIAREQLQMARADDQIFYYN